MTNQQVLKAGVAGLGFGATEFLPTLERLPQIQLVAGADLRPHALRAFEERYGGRGYGSVEELCADPEVEAVWIATPNQYHAEHAVTCAEHGKHMVLRKPMGLSVDECQRVLDAVEKNGVKLLAGGQTQGTSPLIHEARRVIKSGELGRVRAINVWAYTGWMLRPRMPQEVDEDLGGGVVWRQAPHQLETVRYLAGGLVRSVRATTGRWRPERPNASGYFSAFLDFEDGTAVTLVYDAYGFFDSVDLVSWGADRGMEERVRFRKALLAGTANEEAGKEATRFAGQQEGGAPRAAQAASAGQRGPRQYQPGNLGVFVVSCERGDLRMSPNGLFVYDEEGMREVEVPQSTAPGMSLDSEVLELYNAVKHNTPLFHDGRWGMATAEVQWAIIESAKQRREIMLQHQVPVPEGY